MSDVTRILVAIDQGDPQAAAQLLPVVYDELRRLAAQRLGREKAGQTLQATALVHEAYLRLVGPQHSQQWNSRGHFFAAAAEAMRRILIEGARRKQARRHGGDRPRVELDDEDFISPEIPDDWLVLDDALTCLAREDSAAADLAKLRLFAGFTVEEAGEALGVSRATAFRDWTYARAWLQAHLRDTDQASPV